MHVKTTKNNNINSKFKIFLRRLWQCRRKGSSSCFCCAAAKRRSNVARGGGVESPFKRGAHFRRTGTGRDPGPSFGISIWRPEIGRPGLIGLIGIWILKHKIFFFFFLSSFLSFFPSFFFSFLLGLKIYSICLKKKKKNHFYKIAI